MDKEERRTKQKRFDMFLMLLPYMCLAFVCIFFIVMTNGRILLSVNITNIIGQLIVLLLVSIGSIFISAQGELDISIGATLGISCLAGILTVMHLTENVIIVILVCVAVSMGVKTFIGFLIAKFRLPVFLATLIMKVILTAALAYLCLMFNNSTSSASSGISIPGTSSILYYDNVFFKIGCFAVLLAVEVFFLRYRRLGKYCKALGGSIACSVQSGVNRGRYMIYAFMFSGFASGLAAFVYMLRVRQVTSSSGDGLELSVIIAIVIGGMSLNGGAKTKALAPVVGAMVYIILDYGLVMIGTPTGIIQAVRAIVFLAMIGVVNSKQKLVELPR